MSIQETAGSKLVELTFNRTADWISSKINGAKTIKNIDELNGYYQDMFNQLLQDKMDLISLVHEYKAALEEAKINDEDLENVRLTMANIFNVITSYMETEVERTGEGGDNLDNLKETLPTILKLVNTNTLQTMQILGFNYKEAIGKPLTIGVQQLILDKVVQSDEPTSEQV